MDWPEGSFSNQLFIAAYYSDGSTTPDYTGYVIWGTDNAAAKISSSGLFTSGSVDQDTAVTITASEGDVTGKLVINILNGNLIIAHIFSDNDGDLTHDGDYVVSVGNTEQWRCFCEISTSSHKFDLTRDASWGSHYPNTVTVDNGGVGGKVSRLLGGPTVIFCSIQRDTFNIATNVVAN